MNKNTRTKLVKFIPFKFKKYIFKLKLYLKAPLLLFLSKTSFKTSPPPVLLLSFPRSGSSWVGSIMGIAQHVRYLREPATTNYTLTKPKRVSVFDQESCDNWPEYQKYIDESFAAKPNFTNAVVAFPKQWQSTKQSKKLLIKEVNPLVISYYLNKSVKIIYLVRHPFSVAKSYQALNWRSSNLFSKRFNKQTLEDINNLAPNIQKESVWVQMGYLQGWVEALVKNSLPENSNLTEIVRYEDICQTPEDKFKQLFDFANFNYSSDVLKRIKVSLSKKNEVAAGDFSLVRNKSALEKINVKPEEQENYTALITAYEQAIIDYSQNKKLIKNIIPCYLKNSSLVHFC